MGETIGKEQEMVDLRKITIGLSKSVKIVDDFMGAMEAIVLSVVSRGASWAAAIPNAMMVARATGEIFELSPMLSGITAISLELVGQGLSALWLRDVEWNRQKRKSDPKANVSFSLGLMSVYFMLDVGIVAALVIPRYVAMEDFRQLVALFYPVCSILSTIGLNLRAAQFKRESNIERERMEAKERRILKKAQREADRRPEQVPVMSAPGTDTEEYARSVLEQRPGMTGSELGRLLGRSERYGRRLKTRLGKAGDNGKEHG